MYGTILKNQKIRKGKRNIMNLIKLSDTLFLDIDRKQLLENDKTIDITNLQYKLLIYLIENAGATVSNEQIIINVWGYDKLINDADENKYLKSDQLVRDTISQLRKISPELKRIIHTKRALGYFIECNRNELGPKIEPINSEDSQKKPIENNSFKTSITHFAELVYLDSSSSTDFFLGESKNRDIYESLLNIEITIDKNNPFAAEILSTVKKMAESYYNLVDICLCIHQCGEYIGNNQLNEYVVSNSHFLNCLELYAHKTGNTIDISKCINDISYTVDKFIELMQTEEGTQQFLDFIFYSPDRILLQMDEQRNTLHKLINQYYEFY